MTSLFDLSGKSAIVTGSSRGIGKAIAHRLAEHGADVLVSSRSANDCAGAAEEINGLVGRKAAVPFAADLTDKAKLKAMVDHADKTFGKIDILVCNAAVNTHFGSMREVPDTAFAEILQTNVISNNWLVQWIAPQMMARRDGAIIITSSIGGYRGNPNTGPYSISKAGDMAMARALAHDLGPYNIRVNTIAPGLVDTEIARDLLADPAFVERYTKSSPLRRVGQPDDIAGMAVYLAAPASRWTTGQTFVVDGGALA
ncbi:MAG: SDR family NAD(P)-dependent oxidoreductase [Hyphomonadaceae bacterium]